MMKRVIPGLLLAIFWLLLLLFGPLSLFYLVVTVVIYVAADEYLRMAYQGRSLSLIHRLFLNGVLILPVLATIVSENYNMVLGTALFSAFILSLRHLYLFGKNGATAEEGYLLFCRDIFGLLYVGVLSAHICLIRIMPEGADWLLIASAITASSDTGAYFSGMALGKHKLSPLVSPKKTVEGAVGGVLSSIVVGLVFGYLLLDDPNPGYLACIAVLLSIVGIFGDLVESVIKRGTGTKDSGRLLAGHGGILDRIDSLLFAIPVLYYIIIFFHIAV